MKSFNPQRLYSLRADATALGGYLDKPVEQPIPTLAPVSLPPVGGVAKARSEAFTLDDIISCSSAHTLVSGREDPSGGASSILVKAVIEQLNILEVVRARRIVMQLSITLPEEGPIGISLAGSTFEGLRLGGHECEVKLNRELQSPRDSKELLTWREVGRQTSRAQRDGLLNGFKEHGEEAYQWAVSRHRWMTSELPECGFAQASLIDSLGVSGTCRSHGHVVEITEFGRVFLGELFVAHNTVQLVGIRAELGCPVAGRVSTNAVGGGGVRDN